MEGSAVEDDLLQRVEGQLENVDRGFRKAVRDRRNSLPQAPQLELRGRGRACSRFRRVGVLRKEGKEELPVWPFSDEQRVRSRQSCPPTHRNAGHRRSSREAYRS